MVYHDLTSHDGLSGRALVGRLAGIDSPNSVDMDKLNGVDEATIKSIDGNTLKSVDEDSR